ncbi:MAG: putative toxin-antitoxin system toxin component, PIN family [Planctomycetota bacterium]
MRVFLDTNVFFSAFATRGLCADVVRVCLARHDLVVGDTVLTELGRALETKVRAAPGTVDAVLAFLRREASVVSGATPHISEVLDPSDAQILAEAVTGAADVLVTGDEDLLALGDGAPLPILSPREFWEKLRSGTESSDLG